LDEGAKIIGEILGIIGTAVVLSIGLYYYIGGTAYVKSFGVAVPQFVKGVENFQSAYPTSRAA
jgi:hypothetical protein